MIAKRYNGLGVLGLVLAALSVRWLITPTSHPSASNARITAVWIQLAIGALLVALPVLRFRR